MNGVGPKDHFEFEDKRKKLAPLDKEEAIKLLYQWVKIGHLSFKGFRSLLYEKMGVSDEV